MNIHDVLSPTAITVARVIGYGALLVGWAVIMMAGLRLYGQGRASYNRFKHWR
jgi:hypothetical protein